MNPVTPYFLPGLAGLIVLVPILILTHRWDVGDWPRPTPPGGPSAASRMRRTWIKVSIFTVMLVAAFVWSGDVVTAASGGGHGGEALPTGVSIAGGEQIFWGAGKCSTCHSVGTRGGKIRGPNLGGQPGTAVAAATPELASADHAHGGPEPAGSDAHAPGEAIPPIGIHAQIMANERAAQLGHPMTGTDYLVESIANPSAFLAHGFKDEMPKVYLPPVSLTPDQITSVILYLQSLGGTPDPSAIHLPPEILQAAAAHQTAAAWKPYLSGDTARGREIFFDLGGPFACARCHRVGGKGGTAGPDLTSVAASRAPEFIVEKLLNPSKEMTTGSDTTPFHSSLVAVDFAKRINLKDFHDLLAFLEGLQPVQPGGGDSARGRALFFDVAGRAACAKCHRAKREGGDVGPELSAIVAIRSPQFILESILDVNKHVASGYETMQIKTRDGRTLEGIIVRSTGASVWLGNADGKVVEVPSSDIVGRQALATSLMPDTLAKVLSPKDLADLMAFLQTLH